MANHKAWPDEGEMVRMTIYLPKRLRDKLRAKSDRTGTSVSRELTKLILKVGPEKVMMGSDFPWYTILHQVENP